MFQYERCTFPRIEVEVGPGTQLTIQDSGIFVIGIVLKESFVPT